MAKFPLSSDDVKNQVKALLNDATNINFSSQHLDDWVRLACIDVSTKTMCCEEIASVATIAGQLEYDFPVTGTIPKIDGLKIYAATFGTKGLVKIHPRMLGHVASTSGNSPVYFYEFKGKVGFYPIAAGTATVYFSYISDIIGDIPNKYSRYLILYVAAMAKIRDRKYAEANVFWTQYNSSIAFHRIDLYDRGIDSEDLFKIPDRSVVVGQQ